MNNKAGTNLWNLEMLLKIVNESFARILKSYKNN